MNEVPQLLVAWSSPWPEFVSAVGPALRRSPPKLTGEARAGLFPWRGILVALLLEIAAALATAVAHPIENTGLAALEDQPRSHDVIFFSTNELPRTEDLGGAPAGSEGKSGGASAHHAVQTIKVARGESLRERVIDAPRLNLPKSDSAIKNLLAYTAEAGPAPAEALHLAKRMPQLVAAVAPPPPELHNQSRRPQLAQPLVVPPPVELPAQSWSAKRNLAVATAVVPPTVTAPAQALSHPARLTLPDETVVAPRPDLRVLIRSRTETTGFVPNVVPPPVEFNAVRGAALGTLSGNQAVAPPPVELQKLPQHAGSTLGNASVAAPPVEVGSRLQARTSLPGSPSVTAPRETTSRKSPETEKAPTSGAIVSLKPGEKLGLPANSERAMLAMSPAGASAGTGNAGGGSGAAGGSRSGSSTSGAGSGAAFTGAGKGADASPRAGTSSYAGPGGSGDRYRGASRVPGVSVSGGDNVVTLPSFGGAEPSAGGRSDVHKNSNGITVVASPRAGGAMNFYGALKGDRVYTIYFKTGAGMVSLQFADPESAVHPYTEDLVAPQALRTDVSSDIPRARLVIKCVLDRSGVLKNVSILQSVDGDFEKQILAALPDWKFSPAFRGSESVEVNVILGFGIDTK